MIITVVSDIKTYLNSDGISIQYCMYLNILCVKILKKSTCSNEKSVQRSTHNPVKHSLIRTWMHGYMTVWSSIVGIPKLKLLICIGIIHTTIYSNIITVFEYCLASE